MDFKRPKLAFGKILIWSKDMAVIDDPKSKKCLNECPNCKAGMEEIEWGLFITEEVVYQEGTCKKCGCYFKEYYEYTDTEFKIDAVPRVKCTYPLSRFYKYMDKVPGGEKVSTTADCKKCKELPMCTANNNCMIHTDSKGNETKYHRTKL